MARRLDRLGYGPAVQLDTTTYGSDLRDVPAAVRDAEARGYDAWLTSEVTHDPLLALGAAAVSSERLLVGSAIAVAFARNPMSLAYAAQDLQRAAGGRLVLGLGSQIRPHITRRFSEPWPDKPAARMREYIQALHAIWACWNDGADLAFEGEHYTHTLMTPFFAPAPVEQRPRVWLAAVGPGMTRVAGEVADGLLCHGFTTADYLRDTTLPALAEGRDRADRPAAAVEVSLPAFTITGYDDEQRAAMRRMVLTQIGFYGSTPAYRPVLEAHGWGDLGEELHRLSRSDGWARMPEAIPDEVVGAFAVTADPDQLGEAVVERFGGLVDRISIPDLIPFEEGHWSHLREVVHAG
jgi:probable F420-dependent oxidoreductase